MHTIFCRPASLDEAVALLANYGEKAVLVNGGTDVVMKLGKQESGPDAVVYIAGIAELRGICRKDGYISIGGAVTYREMQRSPICRSITGLMAALAGLGSPAVRAVATPAGNVGTAAPSADCTTMLAALGAEIVLVRGGGERAVPVEAFFTGSYHTVRQPEEIIREIRFASPAPGEGSGYYRVARRKAQDIGKVLAGARLRVANGVCESAQISLGALNATVVRARSVEKEIVGMDREAALQSIRSHFPAEAGLRESYFKRYKQLVTPAVVERAVAMAWDDAEGRG